MLSQEEQQQAGKPVYQVKQCVVVRHGLLRQLAAPSCWLNSHDSDRQWGQPSNAVSHTLVRLNRPCC